MIEAAVLIGEATMGAYKYYPLVQKSDHPEWGRKWEFPGGRLEKEETHLEAAIREFREETGYSSEIMNVEEWKKVNLFGENIYKITMFRADLVMGPLHPTDSDEIIKRGWFREDNILSLDLTNMYRAIYEEIYLNPSQVETS